MTFIQRTLWDLLPAKLRPPAKPVRPARPPQVRVKPKPKPAPPKVIVEVPPPPPTAAPTPTAAPAKGATIRERYEHMTRHALREHGIRVRKWRTSMSGVAWQVTYADGTTSKLIESPRPRGPVSAAIFLHEVGHHAIGFNVYRPRCLEEYHAWMWSLAAMERYDLNITDQVHKRVHESLHYAIDKAARRGLKRLPVELTPYLERPGSRTKQRA